MKKIEISNPVALQHEIEKLIHVHSGVEEHVSFMERYPEVYHIYRILKTLAEGGKRSEGNSS